MGRRPGSIDVDQINFQEAVSQDVSISGSLTLGSDFIISQYIKHSGDENTLINFADDKIILKSGGKAMITMEEKGSAPHEVTINDGSNNIDFVVKGNGSNQGNPGIKFDASTNKLGINGVGDPSWELDVAGDVGVAEYIYHRTDTDTFIRFEDNHISMSAGGSAMTYDGTDLTVPAITVSPSEKVNKKAISFDGTNDVVVVSDQDEYSPTNGSTDTAFSISAWVYVGDVSEDNGPFVAKSNNTIAVRNEYIFKHANGEVQLFIYDSTVNANGNQIRAQANAATLSDATWHHVVATYDGSTNASGIKLYTDASQTAATNNETGTYVRLRNSSTALTFGATEDAANANRIFEDRMADVVFFNKELSSAEVTEIYNSGKVMNVRNHSAFANVVSWWKMGDDQDTDGSNGIIDYVSGYHGTLTNGASIIDETGLSSDTLDSLNTNTSGSLGIGIESPDESLHVYGNTKLEGPLILRERTYDPDDPAEGGSVIWMSNGNGTGDDGDILIKITAGGSTKTVTLVDFSAS